MVKTPTYYVFEMFKRHQDATLVDCYLDVPVRECEGYTIPLVSSSASVNEDGELTITLANPCLTEEVACVITVGGGYTSVSGTVLTGGMGDYNSFEQDDVVKPSDFDGAELLDGILGVQLPACSVMTLVLK